MSEAKILLADDDEELCQLLRDFLGREGFAVDVLAQCGQHQHRDLRVAAQLAQDVQAGAVRQHHVEDQRVVAAVRREPQGALAVVRDVDGEAFAAEKIGQQLGQFDVIVGEQDLGIAHGTRSLRTRCSVVPPPQPGVCKRLRLLTPICASAALALALALVIPADAGIQPSLFLYLVIPAAFNSEAGQAGIQCLFLRF